MRACPDCCCSTNEGGYGDEDDEYEEGEGGEGRPQGAIDDQQRDYLIAQREEALLQQFAQWTPAQLKAVRAGPQDGL